MKPWQMWLCTGALLLIVLVCLLVFVVGVPLFWVLFAIAATVFLYVLADEQRKVR